MLVLTIILLSVCTMMSYSWTNWCDFHLEPCISRLDHPFFFFSTETQVTCAITEPSLFICALKYYMYFCLEFDHTLLTVSKDLTQWPKLKTTKKAATTGFHTRLLTDPCHHNGTVHFPRMLCPALGCKSIDNIYLWGSNAVTLRSNIKEINKIITGNRTIITCLPLYIFIQN